MTPELRQYMESLPKTAGVYLFYAGKEIIYIGKAINLRDRVKNHFMQPTYKDSVFVGSITKIDFINTDSEIEALVLEAQLIKKQLPKFNVVWKDGKNYFYVAVTKGSRPIVFITHQKNNLNTKYIGPFIEGNSLKKVLKFLRRVFPYYTTERHPKMKCTWCHLDLCPGPTPNLAEYKKNIKKLELILEGKRKTVFYALKKEMAALATQNKFEEAGKLRDKMQALQQVMAHTHVIGNEKDKFASNNVNDEKWIQTQKIFQGILGLKTPISKIECYDISNIQGKFAVGSMVVFVNGRPDKSQYKKFKIRVADFGDTNLQITSESTNKRNYELVENKPNDIAMLEQVLTRRLNHPEWGYPEIMLIDGGIAQLNIALKVKSQNAKFKGKVISIAKGKRELLIEPTSPAGRGTAKIPLKNLPQDIYNVIVALDDEAHRFAVTYHKKVRKRALLT